MFLQKQERKQRERDKKNKTQKKKEKKIAVVWSIPFNSLFNFPFSFFSFFWGGDLIIQLCLPTHQGHEWIAESRSWLRLVWVFWWYLFCWVSCLISSLLVNLVLFFFSLRLRIFLNLSSFACLFVSSYPILSLYLFAYFKYFSYLLSFSLRHNHPLILLLLSFHPYLFYSIFSASFPPSLAILMLFKSLLASVIIISLFSSSAYSLLIPFYILLYSLSLPLLLFFARFSVEKPISLLSYLHAWP